ncbi:MAG: hypothetical protein JSW51_03525 [Gemmatimonadota bacterium]|nr:MAG: hypothetical protein JSW51_03525 [Gemmatimonadota bacterium]
MTRAVLGSALAMLLVTGCSNVVHFTSGRPSSLDERTEVTVIDGRNMSRAELESVAREYEFMARWGKRVFGDEDYEDKLQAQVDEAVGKTRELGYRVLFYTDDSEAVAIVLQDARAAGRSGDIVLYALRQR